MSEETKSGLKLFLELKQCKDFHHEERWATLKIQRRMYDGC